MTKNLYKRCITVALAVLALAAAALASDTLKCAECGMLVDRNAPFSAKIVTGSQERYFCDIGDLLLYLKDKKTDTVNARVKDYASGSWIAAADAFYVHAPLRFTTPMGWSIAAFRERKAAGEYGTPAEIVTISKRFAK